jgi:hypothetical protein
VKRKLEEKGWLVRQSKGSRGPYDLYALKGVESSWCKSRAVDPVSAAEKESSSCEQLGRKGQQRP